MPERRGGNPGENHDGEEFRKRGSEWFDGQTYLFSYDQKGNVLLNPAFPKREGTNVSGQTDASGKKFHDLMLETARTKGAGWVDYMFPKPGQTAPSHKWTYVKRVTIDGAPACSVPLLPRLSGPSSSLRSESPDESVAEAHRTLEQDAPLRLTTVVATIRLRLRPRSCAADA